MKKHLLTLCLFIISNFLHAQDIAFIPSTYIGGYNVTCNGATDGTLQAILNGDGAPYTYQWSNGSYSSTITNIGAGVYTLTVTNTYGAQITNSFEMLQPNPLSALAYVSDYNGSNVSENGGRDGEITIEATGGGAANNSTYLWSNGANERIISNLQAGTYTVTITDPNQCTYTLSRTLIEPQLLQITGVTKSNYNGFNTACYGFGDGWAEVSAIGGTTPYTYRWSNGSFRQRAEDLNAGNYAVEVIDANNIKAVATITITQPDKLEPNLNVTTYPNGYNISCFNCSNGAASLAITGGVSPFSIAWSIGANANSISGLNAGNYNLMITDANGCIDSKDFNVTQPDREDWSMNGNTNSNPATQYMGTADSTDFKIKTKGVERMKFGSDGEIYIDSTSKLMQNGPGALYIDANGKLKTSAVDVLAAPCAGLATPPAKWNSSNTDLNLFTCPQTAVGIGDWSIPSGIGFYVNVPSRFDFPIGIGGMPLLNAKISVFGAGFIGSNSFYNSLTGQLPSNGLVIEGNVRIGNNYLNNDYKLAVSGKMICEEVLVKLNVNWPDYVFDNLYKRLPLLELEKFINENKHLPKLPSSKEVEKEEVINIGKLQLTLLEKIEELTLYIIELKKENNQLRSDFENEKDENK